MAGSCSVSAILTATQPKIRASADAECMLKIWIGDKPATMEQIFLIAKAINENESVKIAMSQAYYDLNFPI
jgi:hypothetical protein